MIVRDDGWSSDAGRVIDRMGVYLRLHALCPIALRVGHDHSIVLGDQKPARNVLPKRRATGMQFSDIGRCTAARSSADACWANAVSKALLRVAPPLWTTVVSVPPGIDYVEAYSTDHGIGNSLNS